MNVLGFLIIIGVVVFAVFQVIGMVQDFKARKKKDVIKDKSTKVDENITKDSNK